MTLNWQRFGGPGDLREVVYASPGKVRFMSGPSTNKRWPWRLLFFGPEGLLDDQLCESREAAKAEAERLWNTFGKET